MHIAVRYDGEVDALSIDLAAPIAEGEIARDVGPQLTPNRQWIHLGYDQADMLRSIEILGASTVVDPTVITSSAVQLIVDEDTDEAELVLGAELAGAPGAELTEIGPQLTPSRDRITMVYDAKDRLVKVTVHGQSRVLPRGDA